MASIAPKRRVSRQRRDTRRANWKLATPQLVPCPQCHALIRAHRVCSECGYYKGKEVVAKEA